MAMQSAIIDIEGRAIGADRFRVVAHVDEDMGMIEGRQSANAHELLRTDPHRAEAGLVVEMWRGVIGCHSGPQQVRTGRTIMKGGGFG